MPSRLTVAARSITALRACSACARAVLRPSAASRSRNDAPGFSGADAVRSPAAAAAQSIGLEQHDLAAGRGAGIRRHHAGQAAADDDQRRVLVALEGRVHGTLLRGHAVEPGRHTVSGDRHGGILLEGTGCRYPVPGSGSPGNAADSAHRAPEPRPFQAPETRHPVPVPPPTSPSPPAPGASSSARRRSDSHRARRRSAPRDGRAPPGTPGWWRRHGRPRGPRVGRPMARATSA